MNTSTKFAICILLIAASTVHAQRNGGKNRDRGDALNVPNHPQEIGESGIAWYTTWATGLAEAKRSNRPILFMSAATVCSGVSGVF